MEPVTVAVICATVFGGVVALSAFIRQLLLSRNQSVNEKSQRRALDQESFKLKNLRKELESQQRFKSHYDMLGNNGDAIQYLDDKIEEIIKEKMKLIDRFSELSIKHSHAIIEGKSTPDKKLSCDKLKEEIDKQIKVYDEQLKTLQERRAKLWDKNDELQNYLLAQEAKRNEKLDYLYQRHSEILEKVFVGHNDNRTKIAQQTLTEGTTTFKEMILAPIRFLMSVFSKSAGIDLEQPQIESDNRDDVSNAEDDINQSDSDTDLDDDWESDYDDDYDVDTIKQPVLATL
jgi:DNA-binding transcriptional MerR regulator